VTYQPGQKTAVSEDTHVALSAGLTARVIAMAGSLVNLAGGGQSSEAFHSRPDGAAVFQDGCGGWSYVSNSEAGGSTTYTGGVGALYFNALGEVTGPRVEYSKSILKDTPMATPPSSAIRFLAEGMVALEATTRV